MLIVRFGDVDDIGLIDAQLCGNAGKGSVLNLEKHWPWKTRLDEQGPGKGGIGRRGSGAAVVDYFSHDRAIA